MSPDAQPRTDWPVTLPERYRVRRHIATGGMASVWCAEDLVLSRTVAVKVLAERFAHDQLAMRRFKREARAAARVSTHAHVVTVYDVGDLEPEPGGPPGAFIVMEYLAGGTVADAIRHDSVRRHEAMRWLREAASALDHAHERGIVHRDIKPANFLLDRARILHVADFGIARLTSEDTITTSDQLFGTAAYLSPEQALGREATGASDRYALAVAAFELLVGERPFASEHFSAQARQHIEDPPPSASERNRTIPPAVDAVLHQGLAKDPAQRPASAGELVHALQDALAATPARRAGAMRAPATRPPARRTPGRPGPAPSTAAALGGHGRVREPAPPPRATTTAGTRVGGARSRPRRRGRAVALAALVVAVVVLAGVGVAAMGGSGSPSGAARHAARTVTTTRTHHVSRRPKVAAAPAQPKPKAPATTAPVAHTPPSAGQLQLTGHEQMVAGEYQSAISTLRQAVHTAPPGSLTYAYALYDLGRSMVLGGDPADAIPVLQQRLKIPNQTGVVQQMLDQALAAAGQGQGSGGAPPTSTTPTQPTTPTTPPGREGRGHGHGESGSGGAGLLPPGAGHGAHGNARGHAGHDGRGKGNDALRQFAAGMLD